MSEWHLMADWMTDLPPEHVMLDTKIDDHHGTRNEWRLMRRGNRWWTAATGGTCVYYTPTHWKIPEE